MPAQDVVRMRKRRGLIALLEHADSRDKLKKEKKNKGIKDLPRQQGEEDSQKEGNFQIRVDSDCTC